MPDAMLEDLLRGAVVDGQPHADARDLDVAHNAAAIGIQQAPVGVPRGQLPPGKGIPEGGTEVFIVFLRRFPQRGVILRGKSWCFGCSGRSAGSAGAGSTGRWPPGKIESPAPAEK